MNSQAALLDRFWAKVDKNGDCWLWTGTIQHGYGQFSVGGKSVRAHRWAYERFVGPIPDGLQLDHLCHTRALRDCLDAAACMHRRCVNPEHLEPVSGKENVRRSGLAIARSQATSADLEKAREAGAEWARQHPLSDDQKQRLWALLEPNEQAS